MRMDKGHGQSARKHIYALGDGSSAWIKAMVKVHESIFMRSNFLVGWCFRSEIPRRRQQEQWDLKENKLAGIKLPLRKHSL